MSSLYLLDFAGGKSYVGITTKSPQKRLREHEFAARGKSQLLVHRAIRKHGMPTMTVLAVGTVDQMAELEIAMIDGLDTLVPHGYNLDKGGSCRQPTGDEKRRMSETHKELAKDPAVRERNRKSGKAAHAKLTPAQRTEMNQRRSATMKARWAAMSPEERAAKKWTPEQRQRMSELKRAKA